MGNKTNSIHCVCTTSVEVAVICGTEIVLAPFIMHRKLLKEALLVTEHLVRQKSESITQ